MDLLVNHFSILVNRLVSSRDVNWRVKSVLVLRLIHIFRFLLVVNVRENFLDAWERGCARLSLLDWIELIVFLNLAQFHGRLDDGWSHKLILVVYLKDVRVIAHFVQQLLLVSSLDLPLHHIHVGLLLLKSFEKLVVLSSDPL
jgi:hypothetical protein